MTEFKEYRRKKTAELRPYIEGETTDGISISQCDMENGSPSAGDMIARNPANHSDQWLVAKKYFEDNFELIPSISAAVHNMEPDILLFPAQGGKPFLGKRKINVWVPNDEPDADTGGIFVTWCEESDTALITSRGKDLDFGPVKLRILAQAMLDAADAIERNQKNEAQED